MKEKVLINKKIQPYLLIICIALLVEIFVFNIRSYETLFYKEKLLGELPSRVETDDKRAISSLFIEINGEKVHDIFLNAAMLDEESGALEAVGIEIFVLDRNTKDYRQILNTLVSSDNPSSQYVFNVTEEGVEQIRIDFHIQEGKRLRLYEIKINAHRPLFLVWWRFLIILSIGVGLYLIISLIKTKKKVNDVK